MVLCRSSCQYVVGYMIAVVIISRHHLVDSFDLSAAHFRSLPSVGGFNPFRNDNLMERICPATVCRLVNDQTASREIEVYNDQGMEFDMQDISPNENNEKIAINYASDEIEEEEVDDESLKNNKKKIECSASIMLPFSADVAFTAFSDLTRQPSWCKYLHSVEYIGLVNEDDDGTNDGDLLSQEVPLRSSKWTVGVKGLRFSWTASDTRIIRNKRIEWASTSGLRNIGSVVFTPSSSNSSSQSDSTTHMELCFIFVLPRVVSSLYRRLNIRKYTEDVMLADMLQRFRDVVIEEDL
mmetsp:Transcript_21039/g.31166  ORF Transcript_21039/g.31166 Transcript_21039/m.31166 type:complete len:295 (-) Transcript_21039:102-986(-)